MNRIKELREALNLNQAELASQLEIQKSLISEYENEKKEPSKAVITALMKKFNVNANWLLTGEGSVFVDDNRLTCKSEEQNDLVVEETRIPFYDIDVMAHISEFLDFSDETPAGMLVIPGFRDCLACFPVYGESMEPKISNGDVIAVSKATSCEQILWGEIYLVITDAWRVVKTVHPGKTEEYIILRSINPAFAGDTPVNKKDLRALYLVRGVVSRLTM